MFQHYKQTNVHKSVFTFSLTIPVDTVHSQSKAFDFETKILHETYILMPNKLQKITFKVKYHLFEIKQQKHYRKQDWYKSFFLKFQTF